MGKAGGGRAQVADDQAREGRFDTKSDRYNAQGRIRCSSREADHGNHYRRSPYSGKDGSEGARRPSEPSRQGEEGPEAPGRTQERQEERTLLGVDRGEDISPL